MDIVLSPAGIVELRRPGQGIGDIADAGFKNMLLELPMCCSGRELENTGRKSQEGESGTLVSEKPSVLRVFWEKALDRCKSRGVKATIARAPYLARDTKREDLAELMLQITEESIRLCGKIGCGYLIVRPLVPDSERGQERDWCRGYLLRLADTARDAHVMLLLENQYRSMNGHPVRGICSDGREAARWLDRLNKEAGEERFGFCMDAGVCNLCGQDMREFALALGERIKAVILRDCDGHRESSLLAFTCVYEGQLQTDWLNLIRGLREISFDGQLILDMADTARGFSPLLRPQLLALAKSVADYFKWQIEIENLLKKYDSIVLFGAGNMCRNYMKCYGEKYPPLFTCDNNRTLWGTRFCGLEVKNPEALKNLPKNCMVFVCNIYYREIERQLRDMGIRNIEFFNDEYMPTFYFDRLRGV